jgi:hypothetical protein
MKKMKTTRDIINSLMAILKMFIAVVYLLLKLELGSTNMLILKMQ